MPSQKHYRKCYLIVYDEDEAGFFMSTSAMNDLQELRCFLPKRQGCIQPQSPTPWCNSAPLYMEMMSRFTENTPLMDSGTYFEYFRKKEFQRFPWSLLLEMNNSLHYFCVQFSKQINFAFCNEGALVQFTFWTSVHY